MSRNSYRNTSLDIPSDFRFSFRRLKCTKYLKAASYGLPTIAMYAASQGLGQAELDAMSFLETEVMGLQDMFRPIQSSTQMSGNTTSTDSNAPTDEGGRPQSDETDLTDSGEQSAEQSSDWG